MTDSNLTPEAAPQVNDGVNSAVQEPSAPETMSAAPAPTQAVPTQNQPKTYLERLFDMENKISIFQGAIGELQTAYELVMSTLTEYVTEVNTINSTLLAMVELSEAGTQVTRPNIEANISKKISDRIKDTLKKREEAGMITAISEVTDSMNVISFSTKTEPFSFRLLKQLSEELQKEAVGKKVGDTLGDLTLLGIYKINKQEAPKATEGKV